MLAGGGLAAAIAIGLGPAGSAQDQAQGGAQDRIQGDHFVLHARSLSPASARRAVDVADAAWRATLELTGLRSPKEAQRLPIHVYPTTEAYRAADRRLTGGRFGKNGAFAHWNSRSAHLEFAPPLAADRQRAVPVPFQTLRLLAHEASHLTCFAVTTNYRDHPEWFSEGIATNVTEIVAERVGLIESIDADPYFGRKMMRVMELARTDRLPSAKRILADDLRHLHWLDGYAVRWAFFRHLRLRHGAALKRFAIAVSRMREGRMFKAMCARRLERFVGKDAVASALARSVEAFDPQWIEINRSLETAGADWHHRAFPKSNAITWRVASAGGRRYTVSGRITFGGERDQPQMNVLLDRQRSGFVSIALRPKQVTVFEYQAARRTWRRVAHRKIAAAPRDVPTAFAIERSERRLVVRVAGRVVLTAAFPDRTLSGPWGLGVQAGDWGIWHDVTFRAR